MLDWKIYKEGQGLWARNSVAAAIAIFAVIASNSLYGSLVDPSQQATIELTVWSRWFSVETWPIDYRLTVVAPFLIGIFAFGFWQYNHPGWNDFLIDTENEMRNRVTWPSRREEVNASIVVVIAVILFAGFTFLSDSALWFVFSKLVYAGI